jgi:hypothetical protein
MNDWQNWRFQIKAGCLQLFFEAEYVLHRLGLTHNAL